MPQPLRAALLRSRSHSRSLRIAAAIVGMLAGATSFELAPSLAELPLAVTKLERAEPVDFGKEIMPILRRNCVACHHKAEAEGGLVLESLASIMQGGDSGAGVVPKDPATSLLMTRATGAEEPLMPPEDNSVGAKPLTADELGLLQLWIEQGATGTSEMQPESIEWQAIPESMRSVYAMDVAPNGQLLAFGRGNRVALVDLNTNAEVGQLVDPSLGEAGIADVDLVQSIAFSPDGTRIATGGFRTVRLWKQDRTPVPQSSPVWQQSMRQWSLSRDGATLAFVNVIGDIELWDLATNSKRTTIAAHPESITTLAWLDASSRLVVGDEGGQLSLYDAGTGNALASVTLASAITRIATSGDGVHVALVDESRKVRLWHVAAATESTPIQFNELSPGLADVADASSIVMLAKPQPSVVIASESRGLLIVDVASKNVTRTIDAKSVVSAMAHSNDDTRLFTGGRDGVTRIWNAADGALLATCQGSTQETLRLAQSQTDVNRQKGLLAKHTARTTELQEQLKKEDEALVAATKLRDDAKVANDAAEAKRVEAVALVAATQKTLDTAAAEIVTSKEKLAAVTKQVQDQMAVSAAIPPMIKAKEAELAAANAELAKVEQIVKEELAAKESTVPEPAKDPAPTGEAATDEPAPAETPEATPPAPEAAPDERITKAKELVERLTRELADANQRLKDSDAKVMTLQNEMTQVTQAVAMHQATVDKATKDIEPQKVAVTAAETAKQKTEMDLQKHQRATDAATSAKQRATDAIPAHQTLVDLETRRLARFEHQASAVSASLARPGAEVVALAIDAEAKQVMVLRREGAIDLYRATDGQAIDHLPPSSNSQRESSWTRVSTQPQVGSWAGGIVRSGFAERAEHLSVNKQWTIEKTIGDMSDASRIVDRVTALDFGRDGRTLAVGSGEPSRSGTVKIFSVESGAVVRDLGELHSDNVLGLDFSPDGHTLASAAADKTIRLVNIATGKVARTLEGHTHHVLGVAWHEDGRTLASAGADQTIKVWNSETGETSRTITGFPQELTSLKFVPATNHLVATCGNGQVRLADITNGNAVRNFAAAGDFLFSVALTPDAKKLIAGGQSGVVRVWNLADAAVVAELK